MNEAAEDEGLHLHIINCSSSLFGDGSDPWHPQLGCCTVHPLPVLSRRSLKNHGLSRNLPLHHRLPSLPPPFINATATATATSSPRFRVVVLNASVAPLVSSHSLFLHKSCGGETTRTLAVVVRFPCCSSSALVSDPRLSALVALRGGAFAFWCASVSRAVAVAVAPSFVRLLSTSRCGSYLGSGWHTLPRRRPFFGFALLNSYPPLLLTAHLPVFNPLGAMSSHCAHPLVPSRRHREDSPSAVVPLPPVVPPNQVAGLGEQEVVVLDSPPSAPTPVVAAKRRRGGSLAGSDGSSGLEDSSPDVVVVGEHRRGARGRGGGSAAGWGSVSSSAALPAGRSWQSRGGWSAGGGALTAGSHAPAAAVASMDRAAHRPRWPPSVSPVTDQDLGAIGAASAAPRIPSQSTVQGVQQAAGGGGGSPAGPASGAAGDAAEAISIGSAAPSCSLGAAGGRRGRVLDVVDVSSSPPLPAALGGDRQDESFTDSLSVAVGRPGSVRPHRGRRRTTAAAATARQVADDEMVARSLAAEMTAAAGPRNGAYADQAMGLAAGVGGEYAPSASASSRWRPPNAAMWGSLVPAGQGSSRAAAAAGSSSLSLRAAQVRGRRVTGPGRLWGARHAAAMEMMLAITRESALVGGIGHGQGGGGGFGGGGGYGGGGSGGGGGGGYGGVGGGGWPPLVREGEDEYTALLRLDDAVDSGRLACPPQVLARLPTTTVGQDGERGIGADGSSSCCICMETIVTGDEVRRLPCCHLYHSRCINQWLGVKGVCPVDQRVVKDMVSS